MKKNFTLWPFSIRQFHLSLLLLSITSLFTSIARSQSVTTFNSSGTFVVPAGVTSITVACYGGGGGGGGTAVNPSKGGGGSGGAFAGSVLTVTPGASYTVTVGAGGTHGNSSGDGTGGIGGTSSFSGESNLLTAPGGNGGIGGTSAAPIGTGAAAVISGAQGSTLFYGGAGGNAGASNSGGGGSSAGSSSSGVDASANTGGAAVTDGGNGANGRTSGGNGSAGGSPGGGGAGGWRSSGTARTGGAGGSGMVVVSYFCPASTLPLTEGFNNSSDPSCWNQNILNYGTESTPAVTYDVTGTVEGPSPDYNEYTVSPVEGSGMLIFNSYNCDEGSELRLGLVPLNTVGMANINVNFSMVNDFGYPDAADYLQVQYSTDGGTTWLDAQTPLYRYDGTLDSFQWNQQSVALPNDANNVANLLVGFKFHSEYGNNIYADNLSITAGTTPLALDLISFKGKNSDAVNNLNWVTAEEKNFSHFELERSADGIKFVKIASINGTQNISGNKYAYTDRNPLHGMNIYRLKMVSNNNTFKYSGDISLLVGTAEELDISVFPNPAKEQLNISVNGKIDGIATVLISDVVGNVVRTLSLTANTSQVDVKTLPCGTYFIKYSDNSSSKVTRIVKE